MNFIIGLLGFGFLVLVHELGHYLLARANGVKVEEFSIGMGPTILKKEGKETIWSIKALPIGGACQMKGEATGEEDNSKDSFQEKSPLRRMSIIAAGPIMNLITALLLFSFLVGTSGIVTNVIEKVVDNSPAMDGGILSGDEILSIDGYKTDTFIDVQIGIYKLGANEGIVKVRRNGQVKEIKVKPKINEESGQLMMGIMGKAKDKLGPMEAIKGGYLTMKSMIRQNVFSIGQLVRGKVALKEMGGPVQVLSLASQASKAGFRNFLSFISLISVMLAVFNLMPFPALDGGWLLLLLIELITRRKLPEKFVGIWNLIGFSLLMALMLAVTFKDVFTLFRG